jgi:hypothetical protein
MNVNAIWIIGMTTVWALGCKADNGRVAATGSAKAAEAPVGQTGSAEPPATAGNVNELPGSKSMEGAAVVLGKVADEKRLRPSVKVTVEQIHQQLSKDGISLQNITQVFAGLVGASYCVNGTTPDGVVVAVCEFIDEKHVKDGEAVIIKNYGKFTPDAVRTVHGTTLVTTVNGSVAKVTQSQIIKSLSSL